MRSVRPIYVPIGPSIAYVPLTQGQWACIDSDGVGRVSAHNWYAWWHERTRSFYAMTAGMYLHRFIVNAGPESIDHISRRSLDCRKANLRPANNSQSSANRGKQRNNTSGFVGVTWHNRDERWVAQIKTGGVKKYLGGFSTPEEAHAVYVAAARMYHGEFSPV